MLESPCQLLRQGTEEIGVVWDMNDPQNSRHFTHRKKVVVHELKKQTEKAARIFTLANVTCKLRLFLPD